MDASRVDVEIAVATTVFLAVVRDSIVARAATVPHAAATMISCAAAMLVAAQRDRSASPPALPKCVPNLAPPPAKERREVSAPQDNTAARARELAHSAVLKARAATHLAAMHEPSISWGLLARVRGGPTQRRFRRLRPRVAPARGACGSFKPRSDL